MAGLWDRVEPNAEPRYALHQLNSAFKGFAVDQDVAASGLSRQQATDVVNAWLADEDQAAMAGDILTDFNQILDNIEGQANRTNTLFYMMKVEVGLFLAELGSMPTKPGDDNPEHSWRNMLGLTTVAHTP